MTSHDARRVDNKRYKNSETAQNDKEDETEMISVAICR